MLAAGPPTAVIVAAIGFAGTVIASWLVYRRGQKVDAVAFSTKQLELVVTGHTALVKELQTEVERIREHRDRCELELEEVSRRLDEQRKLIDEQRTTIARHERRLDEWVREREQ